MNEVSESLLLCHLFCGAEHQTRGFKQADKGASTTTHPPQTVHKQ